MKPNKVIIFSAPSGSGKTTITHDMMRRIPHLAFSISATSRLPRGTEKEGVEYYFLTVEEFRHKIEAGDFVEYEEVYPGKMYGTLKQELARIENRNEIPVFDVDVKGGARLKKLFGDKALFIFVKAPVAMIEERLRNRKTDDESSIQDRIARIPEEMSYESQADISIENIDLQKACNDCEKAIKEFLAK